MYKVLIVEDEMFVRIGIKNSIDWSKFNMTVIADAADGDAALEIYHREKPDIILTDLKMPKMGGMELIKKIREADKETIIIILSCLEEFELARKAIAYGVSDYILKLTTTDEEMSSLLERTRKQLDDNMILNNRSITNKSNDEVIKEKLFRDYVFNGIYDDSQFMDIIRNMKLNINSNRIVMCIMEIYKLEALKAVLGDEKGYLIKSNINNIIYGSVDWKNKGEVFCGDERNIFIFNADESADEEAFYSEINFSLNNLKNSIETFYNISVSFGLSAMGMSLSSLKIMYKQAGEAIENSFINGADIFLYNKSYDSDKVLSERTMVILKLHECLGNIDKIFVKQYEEYIMKIIGNLSGNKIQAQNKFCKLLQWIVNTLHITSDEARDLIISSSRAIQKCDMFDEMVECLRAFLSELRILLTRKKVVSKEILKAIDYIENNYDKDISLNTIADYVNLSQNYFSSLFKKEIQINFVEYLNQVRLEKAKELLIETYLKAYEIGEKVGFGENTYFCKIFKKYTGLTPNEYRKQWLKDWSGEIDNEYN